MTSGASRCGILHASWPSPRTPSPDIFLALIVESWRDSCVARRFLFRPGAGGDGFLHLGHWRVAHCLPVGKALSVPANIAEGCGKSSRKDTVRFLQIALGSAKETENHLLIASDLHYLHPKECEEMLAKIHSIQRMLIGLVRNLPSEGPDYRG